MATFYLIIQFQENIWGKSSTSAMQKGSVCSPLGLFFSTLIFSHTWVQSPCPPTGIARSNQNKTVFPSSECTCITEVHTLLSDQVNNNNVCNAQFQPTSTQINFNGCGRMVSTNCCIQYKVTNYFETFSEKIETHLLTK